MHHCLICRRPLQLSLDICPSCELEMDEETDRIMNMTDEEITAECWANGEDPAEVAARLRAMFEDAYARVVQMDKDKETIQ